MQDFLKNFFNKAKEGVGKMSLAKKIAIGVGIVAIIAVFVFLFSLTSSDTKALLYKKALSPSDFKRVEDKLEGMGINYSTSQGKYFFVDSEEKARELRTQLGMENVVQERKGFDLLGEESLTTTEAQRNLNKQRAIMEALEMHLIALDDVEDAKVIISFSQNENVFKDDFTTNPNSASVQITPSPSSDISENKNKIKGLRNFISNAVPWLNEEEVIILDNQSNVLTDLIDLSGSDEISLAKQRLKVKETMRIQIQNQINDALAKTLTEDRYVAHVNLQLEWKDEEVFESRKLPLIIREDDPNTPYYDGQTLNGLTISEQEVNQKWHGDSFIPEGTPGTETNVPGEVKELADLNNQYTTSTKTTNVVAGGERETRTKKPDYEVEKVNVIVMVDGKWEKEFQDNGDFVLEKGKIKRTYTPFPEAERQRIENQLKAFIVSSERQNDSVTVQSYQFDRSDQFAQENAEYRKQKTNELIITIFVISLLAIIVIAVVARLIVKEMARRKRLREEELARQQQAMREAALRAAEEEGVMLDLSPEDKARLEMQEHAIQLARERPEDVAQLIRTWMAEE